MGRGRNAILHSELTEAFFFFFLATQFGMGDLSSPTRDQTCAPAVEVQSLNHWIPREVPPHTHFFFFPLFLTAAKQWVITY